MKNLTLGSLFDGSGGFPLGGLLSGITPVWASEIEPFPIRVTTKRLPFMKHYGDISQMDGGLIEPVDIITFGSPCTDMSVAGKRAGLDGKQSVLFYEAIRIIKEMRCATNGKYPRWICWENVPGAFSSNSGRDFQAVLEAVIDIVEPGTSVPFPEKGKWPHADCYMGDRWSVAYRTLDAQHWGVPQRRKRIYLVADFADRRGATEVLFKSEGLSRYSAESFRAWQGTAAGVENCFGATGFDGYNASLTGEVSSTIGVNCGMSTGRNGIVLNDQGFSLLFAVILSHKSIRGKHFFRAIIYLPNVISAVAIGNAWLYYVYNYDFGMLNGVLKVFGIAPLKWLGPDLKFGAMIAAAIFGVVGYYMMVFIGGVERIPEDVMEAATLDGANAWQKLTRITLPLLKGTTKTVFTFWTIVAMQFFVWSKVFSPIGSESSTIVPIGYMYEILFGSLQSPEVDIGTGAAVGVLVAAIIMVITSLINRLFKTDDLEL